ncbi:MAG: DUF4250 domain-containing protein [Lachnospiraceae bacterium]|nr:DUF4250 domain-containing protein [Lachnospiraceae bacterium]
MNLPKDPVMRLSVVNTYLRDHYGSLEELCKSLSISQEELISSLETIDYHYSPQTNQFL